MRRNLRTERLAAEIQTQATVLQAQKLELLRSGADLRETLTMMNEILAAATGIAIVGVDRTGRITLFNRGADLFGIPLLYAYIFLAWAGLIALMAWVIEHRAD